jgi:hypothetical protein
MTLILVHAIVGVRASPKQLSDLADFDDRMNQGTFGKIDVMG